ADADARPAGDGSLTDGVSCDDAGCVAQMADGRFVALTLRPDALDDDCERAALLVTPRQTPPGCGSTVINLERLRRQGAMALRWTNPHFSRCFIECCGGLTSTDHSQWR